MRQNAGTAWLCVSLNTQCKIKEGKKEGKTFFIRNETVEKKMVPDNTELGNNECRGADFHIK